MNLITSPQQLTMSTREIAQLLGKQHSNVKISAERLAEKGTIALQEAQYQDPQNKQFYTEYLLKKRDSLILVAQNSPEFTAKIVDRWQELEEGLKQPQLPQLKDPQLAAMVMALTQIDAIKQEQAEMRLAIQNLEAKSKAQPEEYYTVAGYASLRGLRIDTKRAASYGKKATALSKQLGIDICKAHSSLYGEVNTYHVDVLVEVVQ